LLQADLIYGGREKSEAYSSEYLDLLEIEIKQGRLDQKEVDFSLGYQTDFLLLWSYFT
jgi:hypothetical protein